MPTVKGKKPTRQKQTTTTKTPMTRLRIRQIRKAKGMTLEQVASAAGSDPTNISRLERGLQGYTDDSLRAVAKALGVSIIELFIEGELHDQQKGGVPQFKEVPVVSAVLSDEGGQLHAAANPEAHRRSIAFPARHASAYSLQVRGDGLRPRIKSGEFIVVEPEIEAANGDDVILTLKDGRRFLLQLLYQRGGEVAFGSVNESGHTLTHHEDEIEAIHFVAGIVQRAPG